jgi:hypothetical protein
MKALVLRAAFVLLAVEIRICIASRRIATGARRPMASPSRGTL